MMKFQKRFAFFAFGLGVVTLQSDVVAQDNPNSAWQVICKIENQISTDPANRCRMAQTIVSGETQTPLLLARVFRNPEPLLLLTTPLNVFLKPGIQLSIDGAPPASIDFEICNTEGCHTGVPLTGSFVNALRRGFEAKFTYADAQGNAIELPMSLIGFTAGWNELGG